MSLTTRLSRRGWLHRALALSRIYPVSEAVLTRLPAPRRTPAGLRYRITSLDQLGIQGEIFGEQVYAPALSEGPVRTFIDAGCNAGWFALWLAGRQPAERPAGLLVDAHPRLALEAAWHLRANGLEGCHVVHGAVGLPPGSTEAMFNVNPSGSQSSLLDRPAFPPKGRIRRQAVPAVQLGAEWARRFGEQMVDLLKIDVEGQELELVRIEGDFLAARVKAIALEWHKRHVSLGELDLELSALGFERFAVTGESDLSGVAFYRRSPA